MAAAGEHLGDALAQLPGTYYRSFHMVTAPVFIQIVDVLYYYYAEKARTVEKKGAEKGFVATLSRLPLGGSEAARRL